MPLIYGLARVAPTLRHHEIPIAIVLVALGCVLGAVCWCFNSRAGSLLYAISIVSAGTGFLLFIDAHLWWQVGSAFVAYVTFTAGTVVLPMVRDILLAEGYGDSRRRR